MILLTSENFAVEVLQSPLPVLVLFGAVWSILSNHTATKMEALDHTHVKVGRVDVDKSSDLAIRFAVRDMPLVMLFKEGLLVAKDIDLTASLVAAI